MAHGRPFFPDEDAHVARMQTIYVDPRAPRRAAEAHVQLGSAIPRAVQDALNESALEALKEMEHVFDGEIERGPARFTEIHPGSSRSAVDRKRGRWNGGDRDIVSQIHVQRLQSTYLKYVLWVSPVRYPGDTGVARKRNYIPQEETDLTAQGVNITPEGNLPSKAMQRLTTLSNKTRTEKAKYKLKLQAARLAGKKPPKRKIPNRDEVFYGKPYPSVATGWWQRNRAGGIKMLILAAKRSRYPKPYLVPGWNSAVMKAGNEMVALSVRKIEAAAQRVAQSGSTGGSGSGSVI